jgi:hypothetical protein
MVATPDGHRMLLQIVILTGTECGACPQRR